jgi:serine/threonine protein kinase
MLLSMRKEMDLKKHRRYLHDKFVDRDDDDEHTTVIGKGKYGTVYATTDGRVIKKCIVRKKENDMRMALRELFAGIITTQLVCNSLTPNLLMHFFGSFDRLDTNIHFKYIMEHIDTTLSKFTTESSHDCLSLTFQILHALTTIGIIFELTHNDLYDRNILVRLRNTDLSYSVEGECYRFRTRFVIHLCDLGMCGSRMLDTTSNCLPEVCEHMNIEQMPINFGLTETPKHVLYYGLPAFARDSYVFLKQPRLNENVTWRKMCIHFIDSNILRFEVPCALLELMKFAFSNDTLSLVGIQPIRVTARSVADYRLHSSMKPTQIAELVESAKSAFAPKQQDRL